MNWYLEVLKKYAEFNGRARRQEYWMFQLINLAISFAYGLAVGVFAGIVASRDGNPAIVLLLYIPIGIYSLAILIPSIAVCVRRLHDSGKSGWWIFISLVPFLGGIVLLIFMCLDSQPGPHEYGPNPKEIAGYGQAYPTAPRY